MKNTSACRPQWVETKRPASRSSKKEFGPSCKVEGTTSLSSRAGGVVKGGSAGYSYLRRELFQTPHHTMQQHRAANPEVLVGQQGNQRKIHWSKWSTLCLPKELGGMGFKELQKFNDAMMAKQVWRLLEDKNSLFHVFFKENLFPNGNIFSAKEGSGSFAWKSILKGREVIQKGAKWRVGNGENILIYQDRWLPAPSSLIFNPALSSMAVMRRCQC